MSNWNKRHGIKHWDRTKNKVPDQGERIFIRWDGFRFRKFLMSWAKMKGQIK